MSATLVRTLTFEIRHDDAPIRIKFVDLGSIIEIVIRGVESGGSIAFTREQAALVAQALFELTRGES